jgi:hypothetical protein
MLSPLTREISRSVPNPDLSTLYILTPLLHQLMNFPPSNVDCLQGLA